MCAAGIVDFVVSVAYAHVREDIPTTVLNCFRCYFERSVSTAGLVKS